MATKDLLAVLPLCAGLAACASGPRYQEPVGEAGYLGLALCPAAEGLEVVSVNPDSPAERAHFQAGDVITGEGALDLSKPDGRKSLLWAIRDGSGKKLEFRVSRGRKTLSLKAKPEERDVYAKDALYAALSDEVVQGDKVTVAVIPRVNHTRPEFFDSASALEGWQDGMRASIENSFEGLLLNKRLLRCGNYGVADRERTEQVLKELNFQMTGAVSPDTAKKLGGLVGASHLLFVDLTRFQRASGSYEDQTSARLVTVETGSVLTSTKFEQSVP